MRNQTRCPPYSRALFLRVRMFIAWGALAASLALSGGLFSCEKCAEEGVRFEKVLVKVTRPDGSMFEEARETSLFCTCDAGKTLARESYLVLTALVQSLETRIPEMEKEIRGWKLRLENARKTEQAVQKDLSSLRAERTDVRDLIQKATTRLEQIKAERTRYEEKISQIETAKSKEYSQLLRAKHLMETAEKRLAEAGETVPAPEKRAPPDFGISSVADLRTAVSASGAGKPKEVTVSPEGQAEAPSRKPVKTYTLKDGRKIRAKLAMEQGEEVVIKTDDGKMITVKKSEIDRVGEE